MQVVTNENMQEFIQNRSVPEYKPPVEAKTEEKPATPAVTTETKSEAKAQEPKPESERPRGEDGKFLSVEEVANAAAKAAEKKTEDDDGADLTGPIKAKIDKIVAKKHRAMKEAEEFGREEWRARAAAEQRAEALQREIDTLKGVKSDGPKPDGDEPKPEDFKTLGEYTRALTKYEVSQAREQGMKAHAQAQQKAQADERVNTFAQRQDAFKAATPDYEDVIGATELNVPNVAMQYMVDSDFGPQLAYYIAKNPEENTRLSKLSPPRIIAELGKLELKFEKKPEAVVTTAPAPAASTSRAPAPIQPLEGKQTPVTKDPSTMSFQELRSHRMQERAAKGG
jgi:hypothetical protein